ncbi:hypothetical protein BO99DRAFT_255189 [Aspergillus violaceofuscus CBS 115571]|uniref:Uncharacterized protein n=1 Tax=Aspergillus violaceofuscus (strain CBS 115571) TaxID=1450538 RepID=A0A2V5H0M2_ASPV1|nr:hypothetical protein BO99DRAFT_255189 [Aspergillus violaceofuscus CBS 115571]
MLWTVQDKVLENEGERSNLLPAPARLFSCASRMRLRRTRTRTGKCRGPIYLRHGIVEYTHSVPVHGAFELILFVCCGPSMNRPGVGCCSSWLLFLIESRISGELTTTEYLPHCLREVG